MNYVVKVDVIKEYIQKNNITKEKLAKKAKINIDVLNKFFEQVVFDKYMTYDDVDDLFKIAKVMKVDVKTILEINYN